MRKVHFNISLSGLVLFVAIFFGRAYSQNYYALNTKISETSSSGLLQVNKKSEKNKLINVLKELNQVKGAYFMFSDQSLSNKTVNPITDLKPEVEQILDKVLRNTGLTFKKINDKTFVILYSKEDERSVLAPTTDYIRMVPPLEEAKKFYLKDIITGKVVNKDGVGIAGVSVAVKGKNTGTSTNNNGSFTIDAQKGDVLVFTSVGYELQELVVGNDNNLDVQLNETTRQMNEVVVTALGIQRKAKSLTYSTQKVNNADLTTVKDANVINNINGRVAGVTVNRSASGTGGSARVILRGQKSTRENQPLYVIDGIPMANYSPAQPTDVWGQASGSGSGGRDGGDGISNINPDDIENITVLKGAAASALYGSQANNGVILITTKKGKSGQMRVDYSSFITMDKAAYLPKLQFEYKQGNAGAASDGSFSYGPSGSSPNHVKSFFNTGYTWVNSVAINGGTEKAQTYFSYSNTSSHGIMPTNTFNRHNFAVRESMKLFNDKVTLDANVIVASQKVHNRPTSGLYYNPLTGLYLLPRGLDFNNFKNNFEYSSPTRNVNLQNWWNINEDKGLLGDDNQQNPYWVLKRNQTEDELFRIFGSLTLKYQLSQSLSVQARGNVDKSHDDYELKAYAGTQGTLSDKNGRFTLDKTDNTQLYGDVIATFNKDITSKIGIVANVGTSIQDLKVGYRDFFDSKNADLTFANIFTLGNMQLTPGVANYYREGKRKQIQSVFAGVNLNYNSAFYIDLTARNDWSSALSFTPKNSYFYSSIGGNLIISELAQMPGSISFGKIRAAYATVGTDVETYSTYPLNLIRNGVLQSNNKGPLPGTFLKPELSTSLELGTEWRFLDDRLGLDFTWYQTNTKNQYFELSSSTPGTGLSTFFLNAGNIKNSGIEATVDFRSKITNNLDWTSAINFTHNKNKIVELTPQLGGTYDITGAGVNNYALVIKEGGSYGDIKGKKFQRDASGNIIVDDATGKPQAGDFTVVGNPNPKLTVGWNNTFSIKDFTLSFLVNGRFGGKVMSITQAVLDQYGVSKASADARKNGGVDIPASKIGGGAFSGKINAETFFTTVGGRAGITEYYMYDATNVRLQEISAGYRFKIRNDFIKGLNVSLVGKNLFFFTKKAPFDPEASMSTGNGLQGVDVFGLPSVRSYGLNIKMSL
jgi:TonB-linked SusC/RagA family outer membrane protein